MKRTFLLLLFFLPLLAQAQTPEIIGLGYPNYLFNTPTYELMKDTLWFTTYNYGLADVARSNGLYYLGDRYEVSAPQVITGIAIGLYNYHDVNIATDGSIEAILMYPDSIQGRFIRAGSSAFRQYSITKYFDIRSVLRPTDSCIERNPYVAMVEFYFDTPTTVNGTFYVGVTATPAASRVEIKSICALNPDSPWDEFIIPSNGEMVVVENDLSILPNGDGVPFGLNTTWMNRGWPLLFPIIEIPDTDMIPSCRERVHNFRFSRLRLGMPVFEYDSMAGQYGYELQYSRLHQPWEDAVTVSPTGSPFTVADNFDSTVWYKARMRVGCHHACPVHDTVIPGDWGLPIHFHTGVLAPDSLGIAPAANTAALFTLTPNPATGKVTVTVAQPAPKCELTLRDAAGHEVLRKELSTLMNVNPDTGCQFSIPLSLPAGAYFVTLTPPTASSTQRLVVK